MGYFLFIHLKKNKGYSQSIVSGIIYLEAHQIPILAECPIAKC